MITSRRGFARPRYADCNTNSTASVKTSASCQTRRFVAAYRMILGGGATAQCLLTHSGHTPSRQRSFARARAIRPAAPVSGGSAVHLGHWRSIGTRAAGLQSAGPRRCEPFRMASKQTIQMLTIPYEFPYGPAATRGTLLRGCRVLRPVSFCPSLHQRARACRRRR